METKYSIRDLFAYFLVGFFFLLCTFSIFDSHIFTVPVQFNISGNDTTDIIKYYFNKFKNIQGGIILLVPAIYIVGILVHAIDNIFYFISKFIYEKLKTKKKNAFIKFIAFIFFGTQTEYYLDFCDYILNKNINSSYWEVILHSNEGLFRTLFLFTAYHFILHNYLECFFFLIFTYIFHLRAKLIITNERAGLIKKRRIK